MKASEQPIRIEHTLHSTIKNVWEAITQVNQMKSWFFDNIPDFEPTVNFETQFIVHSENRTFTHLWKIVEVIPHQKITYNWKYQEYPGDSLLTFELIEETNHVRLKIVMEILEDFPSNVPEFNRDSCVQGWNYFIGKNLKQYVEATSS